MKNKGVLTIAIISLFIVIGIASYLWYLYFNEYEVKLIEANPEMQFIRDVELVNSGNVNYVNANATDDESIIPVYYFSVKNHSDRNHDYTILLENSDGSDGCSSDTRFTREELEYELTLENKVIKTGGLDTLQDNVLDINTIKANSTNDYSLRIKLKEDDTDYEDKHFHYVINMKEKK